MSSRIVDLRRPRPSPKRESPREAPRSPRQSGPLRLRTRRRRIRVIIAVLFLLIIAGMAYGLHRVSYAPALTVQSVSVSGEKYVPESDIQNDVQTILNDGSRHFIARSNIFTYPKRVIESALVKDFPRIKSATVTRSGIFSTDLAVSVVERHAQARWCTSDASPQCYLFDESGFLFAESSDAEPPKVPYVFSGEISGEPIGQTFAPGHIPGLVALLNNLSQFGYSPTGAQVVSDQDLSVTLGRGYYIKVSFGEDATLVIRNMQLVLSSSALEGKEDQLEYIDLRFGNRVYYKLKGKAETQSQ